MKTTRAISTLLLMSLAIIGCYAAKKKPSNSANQPVAIQNSTPYTNPIMWADVPDLSVTRSGSDFYLISTTMHLMPGAPIMKSKDLVHWAPVSYVFDKLTDTPKYDLNEGTVYGRGQWASSIRFHKGRFYVLFSPNDNPHKAYIFTTTIRPENGKCFREHSIFMMHLCSSMMMTGYMFSPGLVL